MNNEWPDELYQEFNQLLDKYALSGQDSVNFIRGLNESRYLHYWDYIHLDTLLSLQTPKTKFADEKIFITYHQITELYFSLVLHEINKVRKQTQADIAQWLTMLDRVNRYYEQLISSFDIMIKGLDYNQFARFRMALLPASGFQSVQFRLIELAATPVHNLASKSHSVDLQQSIETLFESIYWKQGNIDVKSGAKALTLNQFEKKYDSVLLKVAKDQYQANLSYRYDHLPEQDKRSTLLIEGLKRFDHQANVEWPLKHFQAAAQFLRSKEGDKKATGGTNWKTYLPPKVQLIQFFPQLWSVEEQKHWGKL